MQGLLWNANESNMIDHRLKTTADSASQPRDARAIKVRLAQSPGDGQLWEFFVANHPESTHCHRWGWQQVIQNSVGWPAFYLLAEENGEICGLLPLVWQKSLFFGSFLTSVPYLNAGGILAGNEAAKQALLVEAIAQAGKRKARYLELRQRFNPALDLPTRRHKVAMVLPLPGDQEALWAALPHKVRTDIRKGEKSDLRAEFGGRELLDDFYDVFARNMRELGTPVYGPRFFGEILRVFPVDAHICRVRHGNTTVAASFLIGHKRTLEAVWSSSRYDYLSTRPNMFLYWKILCFAMEKDFRFFDFGRSSVGSGTHRFKKQWGSQEVPLYWAYWLANNAGFPGLNPDNPQYRLAIRVWQHLPVWATRLVGPSIAKRLP